MIRIYLQQLRTTLAEMLQYRASLVIWLIGHVLEPLVFLIVWSTVSTGTGGRVGGYTTNDFAAYFILLMLVNHMGYTWVMWEFEYRIRRGTLSFALLRPVHPIHMDIAYNLSSKLLTFPFMLLVAGILAAFFHPHIAPDAWALIAVVPVMVMVFLVRFLLEWTLAQAAFWTTRISAINQLYYVLMLFLSGQLAPLSLFPAPVQVAARLLPFHWLVEFPVELIMGRVTPVDAGIGMGALVVWLVVAFGLMRLAWRASVRVYSAVGA